MTQSFLWTILFCFLTIGLATSTQAHDPDYRLYIGTYTSGQSKGIYTASMNPETGKISGLKLAAELKNPSFVAIHPDHRSLFAVSEIADLGGKKTGGVAAFMIHPKTFELTLLNQQPSKGQAPCHLVVDQTGKHVLVANYTGGNVASLPILDDGKLGKASSVIQHEGSSVTKRQKGPHAHSINLDAKNQFAFAADLGTDTIYSYQFDAASGKLKSNGTDTKIKAGSGPRHFAFHPSSKLAFTNGELTCTLIAMKYDGSGKLTPYQTLSTLPEGFDGRKSTAEVQVHPNGKFVYVSNRGHDSIAVFKIDDATSQLSRVEITKTGGAEPRNFAITPNGKFLIAENQNSDSIVVFKIDAKTGKLTPNGQELKVGNPVCIKMFLTKH